MRTTWIAGLFFAAALSANGCAINNAQTEDDEQASSAREEAVHTDSIYKKLVGDYVSGDSLSFPTLSLTSGLKGRLYHWDTGIRCITTPCPSGESGKWTVYRSAFSARYYLLLTSAEGKSHWFQVDLDGTGAIKGLRGVWGETAFFVPKRVTDPCMTVKCTAETHCVAQPDGSAACVPNATVGCEAMLCMEGTICINDASGAGACLKCPAKGTTINCMPIVAPEKQAICARAADVQKLCPGVSFVY